MKRFSILFSLLTLFACVAMAAPAGDWKIYPTFHDEARRVIDTPDRVYIQTYSQPINNQASWMREPFSQLFVYDKEADEIMGWTSRNYLSGDKIEFIEYNPFRNYALIVLDDLNIDFICDNGDSYNLGSLTTANITSSKSINSVTFDTDNSLAYIGAGFGFIIVDDAKHEIKSSLLTDKPVSAAARVGDYYILLNEDGVFRARADKMRLQWSDFTQLQSLEPGEQLLPLSSSLFAYSVPSADGWTGKLHIVSLDAEGNATLRHTQPDFNIKASTRNKDGYYVDSWNVSFFLKNDGSLSVRMIPESTYGSRHSSYNGRDFWICEKGKGLRGYRLDGDNFSVTHDYIVPNAPSFLFSQDMVWSDKYGLIVASNGATRQFNRPVFLPARLGTFKDGVWTDRSLEKTNPSRANATCDATGLAIAPDNPDVIARASRYNGIYITDLSNPASMTHLSIDSDPDKGNPGFHTVFPINYNYPSYVGVGHPQFDSDGTLWVARHEYINDNTKPNYTTLYYWKAADRKAGRADAVGTLRVNGITCEVSLFVQPLRVGANRNLLLVNGGESNGSFAIVDHKGTPDDPSDDEVAIMEKDHLRDQDGSTVSFGFIVKFYEDPQTGTIWVATTTGLFTFNAASSLKNPNRVNRIKIARNDGTNLADLLLNGVPVYDITSDAQGRKWFATGGGGLVATSADGHQVYTQLTTDNSYIPDNIVYSVGYCRDSNSLLMSTDKGFAQYFPAGSASGESLDQVRAYPNPVRPDYLGWITIDGLTDGAVVKIVDSMGALVRELGPAEGGMVQWDATNLAYKRVGSGVYYVLASSGPNDSNMAKVTKILVVR